MYRNYSELVDRLHAAGRRRAVVAAAEDAHALEAVADAHGKGVVDYLLVGDRQRILQIAGEHGLRIEPDRIVQAQTGEDAAARAVALIREGSGDFLMKGKLMTATLMREVVNRDTGIRAGGVMSHVAFLEVPAYHKLLAVTDGGMIPHPSLNQKLAIAENAVALLRALGYERPKLAALAAAEEVNSRMPESEEARLVAAHFEGREDCLAQGPLSLDLALSGESAELKGFSGPVAADADILLTPDLACGNMVSKSMIYTGGAVMAGCVLGARVPIVVTSRGAGAQEKYLSLVLAATSCGGALHRQP